MDGTHIHRTTGLSLWFQSQRSVGVLIILCPAVALLHTLTAAVLSVQAGSATATSVHMFTIQLFSVYHCLLWVIVNSKNYVAKCKCINLSNSIIICIHTECG